MSCSDIEKEIATLDTQATENAAAIADLNSKIAALQTALNAAQADADAAQKAADAAAAAAATAKADAIAAAKAEVEAAKAAIEAGVATDLAAVNAKVASVEAALALKADKATVDLLAATLENYMATLSAEDTELWTSVSELLEALTNLQGRLDATEMSVEYLTVAVNEAVESVKAIHTSLASVYDILCVLANQIQSVVFVPEFDTDVVAAQRYTVGQSKTNYIAVATYEVRPAKLAATVTSENVSFSCVDVKTKAAAEAAAAPEYFAAEVLSTDANTGRIVVAAIINDKDSKKTTNDYDVLANGKLAISLNIASVDVTELLIAESQPVNVDMVSSEYVNVEANADVNLAVGFKSAKDFKTTYTYDVEMPWNTAVAESVKPLFTEPVMFNVAGLYLTAEEANAYLGTSLAVTTEVKATYEGKEEKKVYPVAVNGKDINATATLVESADYPGDKAKGKKATAALTVTVKNAKETVATLNGTATYTVTNKKSDIAFASVSEAWKYTYGDKMTVKGRELAVSNYDKFTQNQNLGTFKATWKEGDVEKSATTTVTAMSSKAVKFTDVELPFTPGKETTYTFKGQVIDGTTTYSVAFDVVLAAMPEDQKIDLGTFTVYGDAANSQVVAVSPVAKAIEAIKAYDNSLKLAANTADSFTAVAGVKGDGVTLNGKDADAASMTVKTGVNAKDSKVVEEQSYVTVKPVADYENTIVVTKTYEFCGVQFTYVATVKTVAPVIGVTANEVYVNNGVANVDGTVKLPIEKTATSVTTGKSTAYALDAINLRNYVKVQIPETVKTDGYELRYTLVTPMVDEDGEDLYDSKPSVAQVYKSVDAAVALDWNVKELNTLEYEVALVSTSRGIDRNEDEKINSDDDVVFSSVNVKLQIPTLVTFTADKTVTAKVVNGVDATANIVGAFTVVDKFDNNVFNPFAKDMDHLFSGYYATLDSKGQVVTATSYDDTFFNVYEMNVTIPADDKAKDVIKVYLNDTEISQSQVKFEYKKGQITLSKENANLTGDIKFEVPVTFNSIYGAEQKATAKVVFSKNATTTEAPAEGSLPAPTAGQWVFKCPDMSMGDNTRFVLELGEAGAKIAVNANDAYGDFMSEADLKDAGIFNKWLIMQQYDSYTVTAATSTTGVITVSGTVKSYDPLEGWVESTKSFVIEYSEYTATTMSIYSDYDNIGISNSVSNGDGTYTYSPVATTKSTTALELVQY